VAVLATGVAGGVLEHDRLSAQHAQPPQQGKQAASQQGDNTDKGTQSQEGEKGDHETETK
jgi:hypothetical protein